MLLRLAYVTVTNTFAALRLTADALGRGSRPRIEGEPGKLGRKSLSGIDLVRSCSVGGARQHPVPVLLRSP